MHGIDQNPWNMSQNGPWTGSDPMIDGSSALTDEEWLMVQLGGTTPGFGNGGYPTGDTGISPDLLEAFNGGSSSNNNNNTLCSFAGQGTAATSSTFLGTSGQPTAIAGPSAAST